MWSEAILRVGLSLLLLIPGLWKGLEQKAPTATTYYVSSATGNDSNNGLSTDHPFRTLAKVNSLALQPGDQVLLHCGDTWRGEVLNPTRSGSAASPITFGSYPDAACTNRPTISGAQTIAGWTVYSGSIYMADLSAGSNAGKFTLGINQLFRGNTRLTLGRWPNLNAGDGGYSTVDGQNGNTNLVDNQLPAANWTGAVIHLKAMRWYMVNRVVTGSGSGSLTLAEATDCWTGSCTGWGYFINNHLSTLDQDGEWYYDTASHRVYLYSASGAPADGVIEGSAILKSDDRFWGGVLLGTDLGNPVSDVIIQNLAVIRWYANGIAMPTNYRASDGARVTLRNNLIQDVDQAGISLASWVYDASDGVDGWRGGTGMQIRDNIIDTANHFGIDGYERESYIVGNQIRNVALIANLGRSGMGCGFEGSNCTENGDGIRLKVDNVGRSAYGNTLQENRLEKIGHNGVDIFGPSNTLERNFIYQACYSKGDCGAVRTFGRDNFTSTPVHDLIIRQNIFVDTIGNTDGNHTSYRPLFGFGVYIDSYSRNVTVSDNTVISSTVAGILFQDSNGTIEGNTLYANSAGSMTTGQVVIVPAGVQITAFRNNILFAVKDGARTLSLESKDNLTTSDYNDFFNPYRAANISVSGDKTLAAWQSYSGKDSHSHASWFTQTVGTAPRSVIFYNPTTQTLSVDLGVERYMDLEQRETVGSLSLEPYGSRILIVDTERAFSSSALDFGLVILGQSSPTQTVTWKNVTGNATTIADVTASGDYSVTYSCPGSLAAGAICSLGVTFNPTVVGTRTGTLMLTAGTGSTYTVRLTGKGVNNILKVCLPLILKGG